MNDHERARDLVFRERVEGLASADRQWLAAHLDACADCGSLATGLDSALRGLSFSPLAAPASLVSRTQLRVAERAAELRRAQQTLLPLRIVVALVTGVALFNVPLLWEGGQWIAERLEWSLYTSAAAFLLVWVAPAVVISIFLAASGAHLARWRQEFRHAEER